MVGNMPQCMSCKHYHHNMKTCDAFNAKPKGWKKDPFWKSIPLEILDNKVDHDKPYPGDHGITYEPAPDVF